MRMVYNDYGWYICGFDNGVIGTVSRTFGHLAFTNAYKLIEVYAI